MIKQLLQKALLMSAFFVSAVSSVQASDGCIANLKKEQVSVRYVYDGDTLQLSDRRRIRLVGLNTPELKKGNVWSRHIAKEAKNYLEQWLSLRQGRLYLQVELDTHDDYGRVLGYIVDAENRDPSVELLEKGLGYAIAIAPNLKKQKCYFKAEQKALLAGAGVWSYDSVIRAKDITKKDAGFSVVQGTVTRQYHFKTSDALVLDEKLVVMLKKAPRISSFIGRKIKVRGWVQATPFRRDNFSAAVTLYLNHTANIEVL